MSNNPFTNNRFKFLHEEKENTSQFKSVKKEKNTPSYDSTNNSFTREKPRFNDRDRRNYNSFNNRNKVVEIVKEVKIFNMQEAEFPEIQTTNTGISIQQPCDNFKFKDALNKKKELVDSELLENNVKPGWVEISSVKGKTVFKEGPLTPYLIQQIEKEEYENTPHYIMNTAITSIIKARDRYISEYNSIHGEGAYEELYILPPAYGPEYDTEDETEDSNESDNSDEF